MNPTRVKRTLIIADLIFLVGLPFTILPAMFSVMLSAGGTSLSTYISIYSLLIFPFVLAFAIVVPWIFYRFQMFRTALALLALPIVNFLVVLFYVVIPE